MSLASRRTWTALTSVKCQGQNVLCVAEESLKFVDLLPNPYYDWWCTYLLCIECNISAIGLNSSKLLLTTAARSMADAVVKSSAIFSVFGSLWPRRGWLPKFKGLFLVLGKIFIKFRSVAFKWSCWRTETDSQTPDKPQPLGGGNKIGS